MNTSDTMRPGTRPEVLLTDDPRRAEVGLRERLQRLEQLSQLLDSAFEIPGTGVRIGWDTLIGLIPGVGDVATAGVSLYIVQQAHRMGASRWTLARMCGNVAVDTVLGSVPLVGDLFDAAYKSNRRNMKLLRKSLKRRGVDLPETTDEPAL